MRGRGRGRGRGAGGRGRGGSRGRGGGRGGRGGRFNRNARGNDEDPNEKECKVIDIKETPKEFFTGTATAEQHFEAQEKDCGRYCSTFILLIKNGIKIAQNAKIRALAVALGRNDHTLVSAFLQTKSQFGLAEVLKAMQILDAGRQVRTLEKKLKSWELSANKVKQQKLGQLKRDINNLNKMRIPHGSASGSRCKYIKKWVCDITTEELEFYAIHFPKEPWKKLADICHFNPKDFKAPWFLPYCFDSGELPEGSIVKVCASLDENNVNDLLKDHIIPFSVLKKFKEKLNNESKKRIAITEPKLDTVLWYYEDLQCSGVEDVIYQRLSRGEPVNLSNGKLLERLLTITIKLSKGDDVGFMQTIENEDNFYTRLLEVAEPKLTSIRLPLESPIAILGDASPSMSVAIRTSTIIASLLTSICSAKLVFFDSVNRDAPFLPKTVKEMLKLALSTKTTGATSPAASLYPFYDRKEIVKTFIVVTDEEENRPFENHMFTPLFKKYHDEVYPATLVFVSFLRSQHASGQMVRQLNAEGIHPVQLRLDGARPDLTKLDDLFGKLSSGTTSFQEELLGTEEEYKEFGISRLFESIKGADSFAEEE